MQKLVSWIGGKRVALKHILPLIPKHQAYIEPFFGGGSVFFAKPPSEVEIINDLDSRLGTLFRVVQHHPDAFLDELQYAINSRQILTESYQQPGLTDVQRAARFYYILKTSFASCASGPPSFSVSAKESRPQRTSKRHIIDLVDQVHRRLDRVCVECQDFETLITRRDSADAFLYVDPPYYGYEACYQQRFSKDDHQRLAAVLAKVKGKWLLSYGAHPAIKRLYKGFRISTIDVTYSAAAKTGKAKKANELLIRNYKI